MGRHPDDVAGVVLLDPTVSSFAHRYDLKEFRPGWNGAVSAREVDAVTSWPDIPFEILRHDPAVYLDHGIWDAEVEEAWITAQDEFAGLAPAGSATEVGGAGHYIYLDEPDISAEAVRRVLSGAEQRALDADAGARCSPACPGNSDMLWV